MRAMVLQCETNSYTARAIPASGLRNARMRPRLDRVLLPRLEPEVAAGDKVDGGPLRAPVP